jgi:peptide/nickel transport system permease protein
MNWRRCFASRSFTIGLALVGLVLLAALTADWLAPFDPMRNNFRARLGAPSATHWFGNDSYGRDILSRVLHGARLSLAIGAAVTLLVAVFGTMIGALAGYFDRADSPLMRMMDGLMAFPPVVLGRASAAVLGPSTVNCIVALVVAYTPRTARVARAAVLVTRQAEYVEAARAMGASHLRILVRHVLANSMAPILVQLTFVFALAILAEAVLSFIGVGPRPPTPTFGNIIADGRNYLAEAPWICAVPGVAIMVLVIGLNLLGDGLRDVLDPRLRLELR